jgi:hypothetical protein
MACQRTCITHCYTSLPHLFLHHSSAKDCAIALAHLVLPTLSRLHVVVKSHDWVGEDVLLMIPYVVRNVCALQDIKPIRSILIDGGDSYANTVTKVLTWTTPGADTEEPTQDILDNFNGNMCKSCSASFLFVASRHGPRLSAAILDALLTLLPTNFISTLTLDCPQLGKEFWISQAPGLPLLEQAQLFPAPAEGFWEMLAEDTPLDGQRLPSLTRLILSSIRLTPLRTYHLRNMLIKRVEQGIPLKFLNLRTCFAAKLAIQLLAEIVVDVQEPLDVPLMEMDEFLNWYGGICYESEVKFDDRQGPR